jgi:Fe2+ transport system protein FeoA
MGLLPGESIQVERVAPLGDPVEFVVKGYHLSLRKADAALILVETVEEGQEALKIPSPGIAPLRLL